MWRTHKVTDAIGLRRGLTDGKASKEGQSHSNKIETQSQASNLIAKSFIQSAANTLCCRLWAKFLYSLTDVHGVVGHKPHLEVDPRTPGLGGEGLLIIMLTTSRLKSLGGSMERGKREKRKFVHADNFLLRHSNTHPIGRTDEYRSATQPHTLLSRWNISELLRVYMLMCTAFMHKSITRWKLMLLADLTGQICLYHFL